MICVDGVYIYISNALITVMYIIVAKYIWCITGVYQIKVLLQS